MAARRKGIEASGMDERAGTSEGSAAGRAALRLCNLLVPPPWEIIYFKLYQSQIAVIERALETAAGA